MKHIETLLEAHKPMSEVGMKGIYSKMPKEKLTMPVKSVAEAIKLAADGEEEFMEILNELLTKVEGAEGKGRIKDTVSIERKLRDYGLEIADLDDVSGKMILVKDFKDMNTLGKILKDDDRVKKITDFTDDEDSHGYYGMNVNYKLSNGLVCELQVITRKNQIFKSICGHIFYEVIRELAPKAGKDEEVARLVDIIDKEMTKAWTDCRKADEAGKVIPYPDIEISDEDMKIIKDNVAPATYERWEMLVNHKAKEMNKKISDKDKKLIEAKSLEEFVKNYTNN